MDNPESEIVKELRGLRTEVEQMHYTVIGAAACVVAVKMFPDTSVPIFVSAILAGLLLEKILSNIPHPKRQGENHN